MFKWLKRLFDRHNIYITKKNLSEGYVMFIVHNHNYNAIKQLNLMNRKMKKCIRDYRLGKPFKGDVDV